MSDRQHLRVNAAETVYLSTDDGRRIGPLSTKNLGMGGMFVVTDARLPVGAGLSVRITRGVLEGESRAKVTRQGKDGLGMSFVDPTPAFSSVLEEILAEIVCSGAEPDERRGEPRHAIGIPVVWQQEGPEVESRLRNLSFRGAWIAGADAPPVGASLTLWLPALTPDEPGASDSCRCRAVVVHRSAEGFGVRFERPNTDFRTAVSRLVQWLNRDRQSS